MNEVQTAAFHLLEQFVSICDQLHLRWYLANGSALGALKYGGFIPWDDDVDVAMPRQDYLKFCEAAQALLPEHVFLQTFRTDPEYLFDFAKLRDTNTTLIDRCVAHLNIRWGICIDIFPLDGYPDDTQDRLRQNRCIKRLRRRQYCGMRQPLPLKGILRDQAFRILGYHKRTHLTLEKLERAATAYGEECANWFHYGDRMQLRGLMPKEIYGQGRSGQFEGLDVILPERCEDYLTRKYGAWRADPPPEQQKSHHFHVALDPHRPYTDYRRVTTP